MDDITDFYDWTQKQADALKRRDGNELDWDNLAEEVDSLGRRDRQAIGNRLTILLIHLLKWRYQPEERSGRWKSSIREARNRIADLLEDSPSLRQEPALRLDKSYKRAVPRVLDETGLYHLPEECPWTIEQVLDDDFLP